MSYENASYSNEPTPLGAISFSTPHANEDKDAKLVYTLLRSHGVQYWGATLHPRKRKWQDHWSRDYSQIQTVGSFQGDRTAPI